MKIKLNLEEARRLATATLNNSANGLPYNVDVAAEDVEIELPAVPATPYKSATLSDYSIYELVECNKKILAIKLLREVSTDYISLTDAKKKVESVHAKLKEEERLTREKLSRVDSPAF